MFFLFLFFKLIISRFYYYFIFIIFIILKIMGIGDWGLVEVEVGVATQTLHTAAIHRDAGDIFFVYLKPREQLLVVEIDFGQLADGIVATQLATIADDHACNAAAYAWYLHQCEAIDTV